MPLEVRVVGIGVIARVVAARPGGARGDMVGVDAHEILAGKRFVRMLERICGRPVGERQRHRAPAPGLVRRAAVERLREPDLRRGSSRSGGEVATAVRGVARVRLVRGERRHRVPLDAERVRQQPGAHVGRPAPRSSAAPRRAAQRAVHRRHRIVDLLEKAEAHRRREEIVPGEELRLRDPHALDEIQGRGRMRRVVGRELLVEAWRQDRVHAHRAQAERRHLREPAPVVGRGHGQLSRLRARDRRSEVHAGDETALTAGRAQQQALAGRARHAQQPAGRVGLGCPGAHTRRRSRRRAGTAAACGREKGDEEQDERAGRQPSRADAGRATNACRPLHSHLDCCRQICRASLPETTPAPRRHPGGDVE